MKVLYLGLFSFLVGVALWMVLSGDEVGPLISAPPTQRTTEQAGKESDPLVRVAIPSQGSTRLLGLVREAESGLGIKGVPVLISFGGQQIEAVSGPKGGIQRFLPAAAVTCDIRVASPWKLARPVAFTIDEATGYRRFVAEVLCPDGLLIGRLELPDGTAVRGISLRIPGSAIRDMSGRDGGFGLRVPSEGHPVSVRIEIDETRNPSRYRLREPDRKYTIGDTAVVTVEKRSEDELRFQLLCEAAFAADVAYAICSRESTRAAESTARPLQRCEVSPDGWVSVKRPARDAGRIQFFVSEAGFEGKSSVLDYRIPQPPTQVRIERIRTQSVAVVDERNQPVAGALVETLAASPRQEGAVCWTESPVDGTHAVAMNGSSRVPIRLGYARTDSRGQASLACDSEPSCVLRCTAEGFSVYVGETTRSTETKKVILSRGASVLVSVANFGDLEDVARSYKAKDVRLVLIDRQGNLLPRDGAMLSGERVTLHGIEDGTWQIWLRGDIEIGFMRIQGIVGRSLGRITTRGAGQHRVAVDLKSAFAGSLVGVAPLEIASEYPGAQVFCVTTDRGWVAESQASGTLREGRFRIEGIAPGRVALHIRFGEQDHTAAIAGRDLVVVGPGEEASAPEFAAHRRVRFQVDAALQKAAQGRPLFLQGVGSDHWILLKTSKGGSAIVGLGKYRLFIGTAGGVECQPCVISASTAVATLRK